MLWRCTKTLVFFNKTSKNSRLHQAQSLLRMVFCSLTPPPARKTHRLRLRKPESIQHTNYFYFIPYSLFSFKKNQGCRADRSNFGRRWFAGPFRSPRCRHEAECSRLQETGKMPNEGESPRSDADFAISSRSLQRPTRRESE